MTRTTLRQIKISNERVKPLANTVNAIAIGIIGFAILRPATDGSLSLGPVSIAWFAAGLAIHLLAHYVLGKLREEE